MKQICIIAKQEFGLVLNITEALEREKINIEDIRVDAYDHTGTAVIILHVQDYDLTLKVLWDLGLQAFSEDVILLMLDDRPGSLGAIARRFSDANIGIRSIRFISRTDKKAFVAVSVERTEEALALVSDVLVA